ncbi:MAG: endolytic transglycosylase MltG [Alphaproteobacteria bacterium]
MRRLVLCIGGLALLILLAVAVLIWGYVEFTSPGPLERATALVIPKGLSVDGIGRRLAEGGVIRDPRIFTIGVHLLRNHRALRAGEYEFPAHASAEAAMEVLIYAKPVVRRLTIAEGITSAQALEEIEHADGLEGAVKETPAEGSLLPETYSFSWGDSREAMVRRMQKAMSETLEALWQARAPDLPLETPEEALVLASIVEKETAKPEERPRIAEVFLNRLRHRMRLQSDPTVVYALTHGKGALGRALTHADLDTGSRYNTYLVDGLPPTPIGNPGKASIIAVLHPDAGDDLYFVADGNGGHVFAKTLAEHNRNVARLRQMQGGVPGQKAE